MRIDAHHHLWKYNERDYVWMTDEMSVLRHDFLEADLEAAAGAAGIEGTVAVQARQMVEETRWLLGRETDLIRGVVGWVPLIEPEVRSYLDEFAANPKLKGVRHVLHDEPDECYMLRTDFNRGIALLRDYGLVYDLLIFERHLPQTLEFVDRHAGQVFIVDHIAKPRIRDGELSPWRERIRDLARRENVYCKLSGMVTEADRHAWTPEQLAPYFEVVLEAFGPERVMFGSDWPVVTLAAEYTAWTDIVSRWTAPLSKEEQESILGKTAEQAYGL
jgi:L-fuconolactonase